MKKVASDILLIGLSLFAVTRISAQTVNDSVKFDYKKIYAFCLDANIAPVFPLIRFNETSKVSDRDIKFKTEFENRFNYPKDRSNYLAEKKSEIDSLLSVFHEYWRKSLLDTAANFDSAMWICLGGFLNKINPSLKQPSINKDSINYYVGSYISHKGLHTTGGIGKTGRLLDLLVWKSETDTVYEFKVNKETIRVRVILMNDFITLGWEEYATLGRYYPAGWATPEALYCVRKAYDLNSEKFLISYLAHEGRHFEDYKLFPKLASADLEYRAKLTELSLAKKTIYSLIEFFIANANYDSHNGHSVANYCVIRDLSRAIFNSQFENDKNKWLEIDPKKINKAAYKILVANSKALRLLGPGIEKYIKP